MEKGPSPGGVDSGPSLLRRATEGVVARRCLPYIIDRIGSHRWMVAAPVILRTEDRVGPLFGRRTEVAIRR